VIQQLKQRILNAIVRGVVNLVNDATGIQTLQVSLLADETQSDVERLQNYGFTSVPAPGAECIVLFVGGNRDHPVALGVDDRATRLKGLLQGDSAQYSLGLCKIICRATGQIEIEAPAGQSISIKSGANLRLEGDTVEIHALSKLSLDCLGNGQVRTPLTVTDYIIGATPTVLPINPPEVP